MKVFYKKSINEKINEEINIASSLNRKIEYIVLTKEEWFELWNNLRSVGVSIFDQARFSEEKYQGIPIHCEENYSMKVVFGKTMLDKTYEKACQVAKENNNKPIEYVILNDLEFALCWSELPSCREVFSNVGMSEQNSTDDTKLFKYKDIYLSNKSR